MPMHGAAGGRRSGAGGGTSIDEHPEGVSSRGRADQESARESARAETPSDGRGSPIDIDEDFGGEWEVKYLQPLQDETPSNSARPSHSAEPVS